LNVATGQVKAGHYGRRRRREFLDFMNEIVAEHPDKEIHVIMDNLNTYKPKRDQWIKRHPEVHLHFTPTHASWLNQIEVWFSLLSRYALKAPPSQALGSYAKRSMLLFPSITKRQPHLNGQSAMSNQFILKINTLIYIGRY
jgi:transposase